MQSALIAGMNAKFHSSLTKIGQFTARHVGQHGDPLDRHTGVGLRDYTRNPWYTYPDTTATFSLLMVFQLGKKPQLKQFEFPFPS